VRSAWPRSPGQRFINAAPKRKRRSVRHAIRRTAIAITASAKWWRRISIASSSSVLAHPRPHGVAFLLIELTVSIRIKALDQIVSPSLPVIASLLEVAQRFRSLRFAERAVSISVESLHEPIAKVWRANVSRIDSSKQLASLLWRKRLGKLSHALRCCNPQLAVVVRFALDELLDAIQIG
jgi:hypothetical protein